MPSETFFTNRSDRLGWNWCWGYLGITRSHLSVYLYVSINLLICKTSDTVEHSLTRLVFFWFQGHFLERGSMPTADLPRQKEYVGDRVEEYVFSKTYGKIYLRNKAYVCPKNCGKSYRHTSTLYVHLKHECGQQKHFVCEYCSKTFAVRKKWTMHMGMVHKQIRH